MAKKIKKKEQKIDINVVGSGLVSEQKITETLEKNYMPYAMSVILSRAIPEIDGFKPSHRKLLYTMYTMNLLGEKRTKSANVVGQTMKLNPHGDMAIYETMVRLARGNESLLHPFVDSKGNFGKVYSRDMAFAASRYTEVKLDKICTEIFRDIDKNTVDFVDNYDSTMKEPVLLPVTFPSVLVNANTGIAVGMASSICPFNLKEVCDATLGVMEDDEFDIMTAIKAPDFPGGGICISSEDDIRTAFETGRGSLRVRAKYRYDKKSNCVEITEIPYTATIESIIDKIVEIVKGGRIRDISDVRDESDLNGLKIAIDLKRGVDADALMLKLYKMTPLEDTFGCNFNILVDGAPQVMGVREILENWLEFRKSCIRRGVVYDLEKKKARLHLMRGLEKILVDIDKAVKIVRETDEDREVIPNLMIGFGIDKIQAEFVAEIKLRHLNREYILNRTKEIDNLVAEIADMEDILKKPARIRKIIAKQLKEIGAKFGQDRKTDVNADVEIYSENAADDMPDYPVNLFMTKEGYFKKITPLSLRMGGEQKLKEGDEIKIATDTTNRAEIIFLTDKGQAYKAFAYEFEDTKASLMGEFIAAKLGFDQGENLLFMFATTDFVGSLLLFFQNGKAAKIDIKSFQTKTKRKKLANSMNTASPLVAAFAEVEPQEYAVKNSAMRLLIVSSAMVPAKTTRSTQGVQAMTLRKNAFVEEVVPAGTITLENIHRYKTKKLPAAGSIFAPDDIGSQLTL